MAKGARVGPACPRSLPHLLWLGHTTPIYSPEASGLCLHYPSAFLPLFSPARARHQALRSLVLASVYFFSPISCPSPSWLLASAGLASSQICSTSGPLHSPFLCLECCVPMARSFLSFTFKVNVANAVAFAFMLFCLITFFFP